MAGLSPEQTPLNDNYPSPALDRSNSGEKRFKCLDIYKTNADNKSMLTNVWKKEKKTSLVSPEPCTSIVERYDFPVSIR